MNMIAPDGQTGRALDGLHPDAGLVGIDFAISIGAYAAARSITQTLGTAHGAGESSGMENALAAHPAIEENLLAYFFHWQEKAFKRSGRGGILRNQFHRVSFSNFIGKSFYAA